MKGGRATDGDTHELVAARALSPCLPHSPQPPLRRVRALGLVQVWLLVLLRKYTVRSGVQCVLEMTTFIRCR